MLDATLIPGNRFLFLSSAALLFAALLLQGVAVHERQSGAGTWSIVAVDVDSGEIGVAGASCVPFPASALAVLAPGQGAAAVQAQMHLPNRSEVMTRLRQGMGASDIIAAVTDPAFDPEFDTRQYGIITVDDGQVEISSFTGEANFAWAGGRHSDGMAVAAQGNILVDSTVVEDALAAFMEEAPASVWLPDRLMRALEAGSAAGGDRRCSANSQTATAAFIAVSQADQAPFVAPLGREPSAADPALPWLYLSVLEPAGGENPLIALRSQYDAWRSANPPVATPELPHQVVDDLVENAGLWLIVILVVAGIGILLLARKALGQG